MELQTSGAYINGILSAEVKKGYMLILDLTASNCINIELYCYMATYNDRVKSPSVWRIMEIMSFVLIIH